jgi:decaprenylphospho-beta-D-ribofuranose 2-oxidase
MGERSLAELADISHAVHDLDCYSGLYAARAMVLAPANLDELRRVFAYARRARCRVTFRAGGHSFDGQALGNDLVVSMARLDRIEVMPEQRKVRVGPGATWGAILAKLEPWGLVPHVTVTTAEATAGGTLSGDCLSRFSPAYGKEGTHVESFELLTTEGELLHCTAPAEGAPAETWTLAERAFCGVIGGLGYLGAVVDITYRVLSVGETNHQIGVRTIVRKYRTFRHLAADLVPTARRTYEETSDPHDPTKLDAIYAALFSGRGGDPYALLFTSAFTCEPHRRRMLVHQPDLAARPLVEWLMRIPLVARTAWPLFFRGYRDGDEFIDDLEGFTFFMDGNARAKAVARRLGLKLRTVQQTFVVPSDPGARGGWDEAEDDLVEWLEHASAFFRARKLQPTLHDVLFLPKNQRFLLSASAELPGFAVSYAFETSDEGEIARIKEAFSDLADVLHQVFEGRVYLVKNVCAKTSTLRAMYGDNASDFFLLKRELDPGSVLRNDFLERTFGDLLAGEAATTQAAE